MKKAIIIAVLWAPIYFVTLCGAFAALQAVPRDQSHRECRGNLAYSVAWALIPASPFVAPFLTGFYFDGFKWPSCAE